MSEPFVYRDLEAWQLGMKLVEQCYRVTAAFPRSELYGLTSQLRRSALSIPSNLAEGHCRRSTKAYLNHISIALGSLGELETCLEISVRLGFLSTESQKPLRELNDSVGRLLSGLHRALRRKIRNRPTCET
jgi:four helix bundle protein